MHKLSIVTAILFNVYSLIASLKHQREINSSKWHDISYQADPC